jgi:hypothetical protein
MNTLARINYGRWIADCPEPGCYDAKGLRLGQTGMVCADGHPSTVVWPSEIERMAVEAALARRALPGDRNWFPEGHPLAETHARGEAGLSPAELDLQTAAHDAAVAAQAHELRQLTGMLERHGLTIGPDGTIHGRLTP